MKSPLPKNTQGQRFIEAARQLGADEDEATFKAKLRVIARQKPKTEPKPRGRPRVNHWWLSQAAELRRRDRLTEADKTDQYEDNKVRRCVVYTREDVAFLVGLLAALKHQAATIKLILIAILVVSISVAVRIFVLN
jgi:hypothetical protein